MMKLSNTEKVPELRESAISDSDGLPGMVELGPSYPSYSSDE